MVGCCVCVSLTVFQDFGLTYAKRGELLDYIRKVSGCMCGWVWVGVGGCVWVWVGVGGYGYGCGWVCMGVGGCVWVWVGGCVWVWVGVGGCGWVWVGVYGCGWVWVGGCHDAHTCYSTVRSIL